jgi:hypothetical protein
MLMTDDQRCNEATRLAAQLLLDAQRRASGAPVFATARGEKAPPLTRFMRESRGGRGYNAGVALAPFAAMNERVSGTAS